MPTLLDNVLDLTQPPAGILDSVLPEIPKIMKNLKWDTASALMQKWFDGPPSSNPSKQAPDITDVKMDWVLRYDRAKAVYDLLIKDRVWSNFAARNLIAQRLKSQRFIQTGSIPFGNLKAPVISIEKNYINSRPFHSSLNDPLDDLYGALGSFNFHVAVEGLVAPFPVKSPYYLQSHALLALPTHEITIKKVGVYVQDSYNFNDDDDEWLSQPLGFWRFDGNGKGDVSKMRALNNVGIFNKTFQHYRDAKGKGGDFLVFSDVKVYEPYPPDKLLLTL